MIAIVDYQAGNIGSIRNMLKKIGYDSLITAAPEEIEKAEHIIVPGVGSFDYGMQKLADFGLVDILNSKKQSGTPILGICLGAQLMCSKSEEGILPGLGWIAGEVKKFSTNEAGKKYTVPHMGWDVVQQTKTSDLFEGVEQPARFYFVHSYYIQCKQPEVVLTQNNYSTNYHSAFEQENVIGVQYHPEKSHKFGKQLLKNFIEKY
jgi:imidazole glycerol-phosphate synthase subunit HisH